MKSQRAMKPASVVRNMWVLTTGVALADSVFGAIFVTHLLDRLGSASTVGTLLMIPALVALVVEAPSGAVGDRYGHRRLAWSGLATWAAGLVVFALAGSAWAFGVAIALWGTGLALYSGTVMALIATHLSQSGRGDEISVAVRGNEVARWGGSALAALGVVVFAAVAGTDVLVGASGVLLVLLAVWTRLGWPESSKLATGSPLVNLLSGARAVVSPRLRSLTVYSALTSVLLGALILTWQSYATTEVGLDTRWLGIVLLLFSVAAAVGASLSRYTTARSPTYTLPALVCLTALALAGVSFGGWAGMGAYLAAELLLGLTLASLATWIQVRLRDGERATVMSIVGTVTGGTIALSHGVTGRLWEDVGLMGALVVMAVAAAVAAVVIALAARLVAQVGRDRSHDSADTFIEAKEKR